MAAIPKLFGTETEFGFSMHEASFVPQHDGPAELIRCALEATGISATKQRHQRSRLLDPFLGLERRSPILREAERILRRRREEERGAAGRIDRGEIISESLRIIGFSGVRLSNGARFYVDCGHPEYSTPECTSARDLVTWQRAGDMIAEAGRRATEETFGVSIDMYKDNSDREGHSFAAHENYCVEPETFEELITPFSPRGTQLESFFVTRQIFAGAGKVGSEDQRRRLPATYQLSQRADFMWKRWERDTMHYRSIINTRDRPYADKQRFRRLHVIVGDANICEFALYLKVGITAMVLKMLEDDFLAQQGSVLCASLRDPVRDIKRVSRDLTTKTYRLTFDSGSKMTALEIQWEFYRMLERYFSEIQESSAEEQDLLEKYRFVLEKLEHVSEDQKQLFGYCDWTTKYVLLQSLQDQEGVAWDDERMRTRDMAYHHLDPKVGLWAWLEERGAMKRISTDEEIREAVSSPPANTRAYLRGTCVEKFQDRIDYMGWQGISFSPTRRNGQYDFARLPDPFIGTKEVVDAFLKDGASLKDLGKLLRELNLPLERSSRSSLGFEWD